MTPSDVTAPPPEKEGLVTWFGRLVKNHNLTRILEYEHVNIYIYIYKYTGDYCRSPVDDSPGLPFKTEK